MKKTKKSERRGFTPWFKENTIGLPQELGDAAAASRQLSASQSLQRSLITKSQLGRGYGLGFGFNQKYGQECPVLRICKVLKVSNSALYSCVEIRKFVVVPKSRADLFAFQKEYHYVDRALQASYNGTNGVTHVRQPTISLDDREFGKF